MSLSQCECEKNEDLKADSAEKDCDYAEKACDSAENCCDFPERCCEFADRPTPFERQCTAAAADDTIERSLEKYSRVQSTLRQFVRDWADEGEKERAMCYGPLIRDLEEYVPIERFRQEHGRRPVVVCPGSGLGRLPFESVRRGYSTQGNEFSHLMLFGADLILNHALPEYELSICPYVLATCNRKSHDDHLVPIRIPNVCPAKHIPRAEDCSVRGICRLDFSDFTDIACSFQCSQANLSRFTKIASRRSTSFSPPFSWTLRRTS